MALDQTITWHEPITYKWAVTKTDPTLLSVAVFFGITLLIVKVTSVFTSQPIIGWPATYVVAVISGLATAYVIPFVVRFGNRTCSIGESGITCDELVVPRWRNTHWDWASIEYCIIKRVVVRRRTYQVLVIHTTNNEDHSLGLNDEMDLQKVESAILRADCKLRTA
jgi:hypothetical protein